MTEPFQPGGRTPAPAPLDLVQDFVNTEIPDWNRDDLGSPAALEAWLRDRRLLDERTSSPGETLSPPAPSAGRSATSRLRTRWVSRSHRRDGAPRSTALSVYPLELRVGRDGPVVAPGGSGAERGLAAIVAVVAAARTGGVWERLKACRQETCGWLFYDGSRNRSSSWCSMQICGGREKARAYRRRHGSDAP